MAEDSWQVLEEKRILEHPYVDVIFQKIQLPDGQIIPDWPIIQTRNYVNAMVVDGAGKAMILEGYKHGHGSSNWQVLGGYLEAGEEPLQAVKRELLEETGYSSNDWWHLGSFTVDANRRVGTGHFFLAQGVQKIADPDYDDLEIFVIRWVSLDDLRQALFDGRVAIASYAINIALGLLALG